MLHLADRQVMGVPARQRGAATQVSFLKIQKEGLVKIADGFHHLAAQH